MRPAPFRYHAPATVREALALLASYENAKLLAGGQSLVPMLNLRMARPDHVVDLNRVAGIDGVELDGDAVVLGAMARQRLLLRDSDLAVRAPIVREALRHVGHEQTRSRGTIGGSLCHLDPAAELPGIAALHDAVFTVATPAGERSIPASAWSAGYLTPAIDPDEMLVSIRMPTWPRQHGYAFEEYARRRGDFAIVAVGALLLLDEKSAVVRAAVVLIGAGPEPIRLARSEAALVGHEIDDDAVHAVADEGSRLPMHDDVHVPASYRRQLARVLTARALRTAATRAKERARVA
jgi:carbon-monoxide dehydrogenase medium subunit